MEDQETLIDYDVFCLEEYKLIQAKFDKIGEARLKIRTWAVTLTLAIVAGFRLGGTTWVILLFAACLVTVLLLLFMGFEYELHRQENAYYKRLSAIMRRVDWKRASRDALPIPRSIQAAQQLKNKDLAPWQVRWLGRLPFVFYIAVICLVVIYSVISIQGL